MEPIIYRGHANCYLLLAPFHYLFLPVPTIYSRVDVQFEATISESKLCIGSASLWYLSLKADVTLVLRVKICH